MFHYTVSSDRIVSSWKTLDEFATPVTKEQEHLIAFRKSPFEDQNNAESDTDLLMRVETAKMGSGGCVGYEDASDYVDPDPEKTKSLTTKRLNERRIAR